MQHVTQRTSLGRLHDFARLFHLGFVRRPGQFDRADRQGDVDSRAFQQREQRRHEALRLVSQPFDELLCGDEGDRRHGAVMRGDAGRVGDAELAQPPQGDIRGDRRDTAEQDRHERRPGDLGKRTVGELHAALETQGQEQVN